MKSILEYLEEHCSEISPFDFYRTIFPEGALDTRGTFAKGKYTGTAVCVGEENKVKRYTITDDLEKITELCGTDEFCLMSPISYAGRSRKSSNARFLYALAIDVDGIRMNEYEGVPVGMWTLFYQFEGNGPSNFLPKPTMIVMSGSGLHLYYVFEKPIPLFPNIVEQLEPYRRQLTWKLWTQGVTTLADQVQYESLFQGFRMPGTITKSGSRARAFVVDDGRKVTMEYMNQFVPEQYRTGDFTYQSSMNLDEAKEKYPRWYQERIIEGKPKGSWTASRAVYDWWKARVLAEAEDGHRYWCVMTLATYAKKCGISRKELEADAFDMVEHLNSVGQRPDNPFTKDDVLSALEAFNDSYITYPIDTIVARTGIPIVKNKRNYRKQSLHLRLARSNLAILNEDRGRALQGRPKGSSTAKIKVIEWRMNNPFGTKTDCVRQTGLSKPTVYKWWDA